MPGAAPFRADSNNNREFIACAVAAEIPIAREVEDLLYDPQTSGGLLIALPESDAAALERSLEGARRIGRVLARGEKPIRLL